jgi:hypothetical protein
MEPLSPPNQPKMRMILIVMVMCSLLQACTTGNANVQSDNDEFSIRTNTTKAGTKKTLISTNADVNYKIYLDNSYSMNGYFNGGSNFLSTVNKLITHLSNVSDDANTDCNLNYINNGVNYFGNTKNSNIGQYLAQINNFYSKDKSGDRKVTDLKDVLRLVIDSIQPNFVNIIISDGIASPGLNGQASDTYLDILQNCIFKSVYSKLSKIEFTTQIIKCKSNYNGTYINQLNKGIKYEGIERPYYIFIMGDDIASKQVSEFIRNSIESSHYQAVVFFNNLHKTTIKSKVLLGTGYEIIGNATTMKIHKNDDNLNEIKLRLLTDFTLIPLDDEYLLNPDNYTIKPAGSQISIAKIANQDDPLNKGFTHKILITVPNLYSNQSACISLKYKLPEWIYKTNTLQDINLSESELKQKTFGFQYIVNGFMDGYRERKLIDNYFTLNITNQ